MVILFLTGSLEPGKDGVGDYTRRLARECARQNHSCYLLSLNDHHLPQPVESTEIEDGVSITVLRLPATLPWDHRIKLACAFRERHPIDWISLQFVSYGYDRKGFARNLARYFKPIIADIRLHIMFHELWIGVGQKPPLKDRVMGQIQRFYLQEFIQRLQPQSVTTSNVFYVSLLKGIEQHAKVLPLFGNIPTREKDTDLCVPGILIRSGICNELGLHPRLWLGLFFGALYPEWKAEPFMSSLISASDKTGTRVSLVSAGRLGSSGEIVWKKLQKTYSSSIDFITLGELTTRQVSSLMQVADFGLAAAPWHLLQKSGTVTAMLDHGLPVIVTRFDYQPEISSSLPVDPLLHVADMSLESKLSVGLPKRPALDSVKKVTADFIQNLFESA